MNKTIKIENLGKKYIINHNFNERYLTLRDQISKSVESLVKNTINSVKGIPIKNKRQEEFWALRNIDLEINQGDKIGIIGRNGAGKSTLLKLLSRITEPSEGRVHIKGKVSSLLEIGTGFHPELTGRENIFLNGSIMGMSKKEIKANFDQIVDFAEIEKFLDTPVKRYSSGMYVRLAFAVAAHLNTEILIIDEVLAVGDSKFQEKCLGKMDEIGKTGRTILFVSHNMSSIKAFCNSGIILDNGKMIYSGQIDSAIDKYNSIIFEDCKNTSLVDRRRPKDCSLTAKIIDFTLVTENGGNQRAIDSTRPFIARFTIDSKENLDCGVRFSISDMIQGVIAFDSAHICNKVYSLKKGRNIVNCRVAPTFLASGDYKIDYCSLIIPSYARIDFINDAYQFSVVSLDPYSTGYNLSQDFTKYHVDQIWEEVIFDPEPSELSSVF